MNNTHSKVEVLAPAGSRESMEAALEAGAGAVYFGLDVLNARRGAQNFTSANLKETVDWVHSYKAKAYLTLNIDLSEREVAHACRILAYCEHIGLDAVILRDPALLLFVNDFPKLDFHLSTQTNMSSSADVRAAKSLGAKRVILARELSLEEIQGASKVSEIETEVFCQGAMCFAFSGRCILSSWGGGKSGNRGTCTSPCRVPWTVGEKRAGRPLSSHDIALVKRVPDLMAAGVASLKIEGRLKTPEWVSQATSIYLNAVDGGDGENLFNQAKELGHYSGRKIMSDLLDGSRTNLTACTGRDPKTGEKRTMPCANCDCFLSRDEKKNKSTDDGPAPFTPFDIQEEEKPSYELSVSLLNGNLNFSIRFGEQEESWTMSLGKMRRPEKAKSLREALEALQYTPLQSMLLTSLEAPEQLPQLMPKNLKEVQSRISKFLHRATRIKPSVVKHPLPERAQNILDQRGPGECNNRRLGHRPECVRILYKDLIKFSEECTKTPSKLIVENASTQDIQEWSTINKDIKTVFALAQVFFDKNEEELRKKLELCKEKGFAVEVNSWGGLQMAREIGVTFEAGQGLQVLNSLCALQLHQLGAQSVTLSVEADREKLESICQNAPLPLSLVVFGRPQLMTTRFEINANYTGKVFEDRRDMRMVPLQEDDIFVFRSLDPFDISRQKNEKIILSQLVADLVCSPKPSQEYEYLCSKAKNNKAFLFNYDRSLS
ncbi:MAG: U32 family peptidase [Planctomycetes bacterium]|nr:U32 family peptidase [Planctomycetota bacterium]